MIQQREKWGEKIGEEMKLKVESENGKRKLMEDGERRQRGKLDWKV